MTDRICEGCGAELEDDARFCEKCGGGVTSRTCPACGAKINPSAQFCKSCGASLATTTPIQPEVTPQQSPPPKGAATEDKEIIRLWQKKLLCRSLGIIFLIVAGVIFAVYYDHDSSSDNQGNGERQDNSGGSLDLITDIDSISYDLLISGSATPLVSAKVWVADNKMRTEMTQEGINTVTLIDGDVQTMYVYMPDQNLAMRMPFDVSQLPETPTGLAATIMDSDAKVSGTETVDGKLCTVVTFIFEDGAVRAWIWQEKKIPIRMLVAIASGVITIEYRNIDFSDIPASMFELPAGVTIM